MQDVMTELAVIVRLEMAGWFLQFVFLDSGESRLKI
jgi:hypothetical protein